VEPPKPLSTSEEVQQSKEYLASFIESAKSEIIASFSA
jgi:hypothetical protein